MLFSLVGRHFLRALGAIGVVGALIAGTTLTGTGNMALAASTITIVGSDTPTFPLGQVDIKLHINNTGGIGGQASLTEPNRLLATADVNAAGDVEFPPSAFANTSSYLSRGTHSITAHYNDDTFNFSVIVDYGQVDTAIDSVVPNNGTSTATFNYHVTQLGETPKNVIFPAGIVSLTEDGKLVATQPVPMQPVNSPTALGSFTGIQLDDAPHVYQIWFRGDNYFAAKTSGPWATAAFINTEIDWKPIPSGKTGQPFDGTTTVATITADEYSSVVNGTVHLIDNNVSVAASQIGANGAISFNYTPTAGSHQFKIHYDGTSAYLPSDSANQSGTYIASTTTTTTAPSNSGGSVAPAGGYRLVGADGAVLSYGVQGYGSLAGKPLNAAIITASHTASDRGYWLLGADGGIFSFGDAQFYGSMGGKSLNKPIVGMAPTPSGAGYWLVGSDGGIFSFGDAGFYGSMGSEHLNKPIVGITAAADGKGYRMVASDGGIFSFGSAAFYGSMGSDHLNKPIVGMASTASGNGYWLVASDGGIFSYGDAQFYGSTGSIQLNKPIVGMRAAANGYWFVASDGGVFNYGNAPFAGSAASTKLNAPIVALS